MNRSLTSIVTSRVEYAQARSGFKSRCEGKRTQKRPFCLNKVQAAGRLLFCCQNRERFMDINTFQLKMLGKSLVMVIDQKGSF